MSENQTPQELETFRTEIRAWIEDNCPAEMRRPMTSDAEICWGGRKFKFQSDAQKTWLDRCAEKGLTAPDWPTQYGGGGLTPPQSKIFKEEMDRAGARSPLRSFGISMLGPALLKFGTEEQKMEHLPKICRGEIRWCQGYSEPGSGSDLASVATKAEDKGDHWIVNGQKIWTSYADEADWIFCLVRTDPTAKKQLGISFVLFDMETLGVSTKPILLISGKSPFCETFFDDVKVPKSNLVGTENRGWDVAKHLLAHEREMISGMGSERSGPMGEEFGDDLKHDPLLRAQMAHFDVRAQAMRATAELFLEDFKRGKAHPAMSSMMKYYGTELNKDRFELLMSGGGAKALEWDSQRSQHGAIPRAWLRTKANSIEGGTSEIQLNIISKRILELPSS